MEESDTDPTLLDCIAEFALGRGECTMVEICRGLDEIYQQMAVDQDAIGWRRFMEGMIVQDFRSIQHQYLQQDESRRSSRKWAQGLITRLMECTHGQWLYRNVVVHDSLRGSEIAAHKEQVRQEIQQQLELGGEGLSEEDQYLLEINLGSMEDSSGKSQEYWLRAIQAARVAKQLRDGIG